MSEDLQSGRARPEETVAAAMAAFAISVWTSSLHSWTQLNWASANPDLLLDELASCDVDFGTLSLLTPQLRMCARSVCVCERECTCVRAPALASHRS